MDESRLARRVMMEDVSGGRVRGRPRLGWMDGVFKGGFGQQRDDSGGCATTYAIDRNEWRALVHM